MLNEGSAGNNAGGTVSVPHTPHHWRSGASIDDLIHKLEGKWQLGLKVRSQDWSPTSARADDQVDKIYGKIKYLFYSSVPALNLAITSFEKQARATLPELQLDLLYQTLLKETKRCNRTSVLGTNTLKQKLQNAVTSPKTSDQAGPPANRFEIRDHDEQDSCYTTAPESGSTTDVEEFDHDSPPDSPSPTPHSRKRRLNTTVDLRTPRKSAHSITKFNSPNESSLPTISKKRQRFQVTRTTTSSTNPSFTDDIWSTQKTQPDTANTSFMTDGTDEATSCPSLRHPYPTADRTSNTLKLIEPQNTSEVRVRGLYMTARNEKSFPQELHREYPSNLGLIDKHPLDDTSFKAEAEATLCSLPDLVRPRSNQLSNNVSMKHTTAEMFLASNSPLSGSAHLSETEVSLNRPLWGPQSAPAKLNPHRNCANALDTTNLASPTPKESHHIRAIPTSNLFVDDIPSETKEIPYFVLFICQRLVSESSLSMQNLVQDLNVTSIWSEPDVFWRAIQGYSHLKHSKRMTPGQNHIWEAAKQNFEGYTFKGQIVFTPKMCGPVFTLQLHPVEIDKSCRLQRKFGSDRFLYLTVPIFDSKKIDRFNAHEMNCIKKRWAEWLLEEHSFLGRKWRVLHVETLKKKKGRRQAAISTHDKRIVLFATKGHNIDQPCSIGDLMNWFMPLADNKSQSFCKAFARLDLGLSRTVPTLIFKPSQIRQAHDIEANGEPESTEYIDRKLQWPHVPPKKVMNDGCALISVRAAHLVWEKYKEDSGASGPLPSVFQGRIKGAKGLWMVSGESSTQDPDDLEVWIVISHSQSKFDSHEEDLDDRTFDPHRLTFEVSNYSSMPPSSELHISFIPILVDRGISKRSIEKCILNCLDTERSQLLSALGNTIKLYDWVHKNNSRAGEKSEITWEASLPFALEEKVKLLLDSGFQPAELSYLASKLELLIETRQIVQETTLRVPLAKSAYLFGIADPFSVLKPGEVHVKLSTMINDERTGETYSCFNNLEILVARQPACRRSDIQKVRTVTYPQLSHLVDVVVFPSRGQYPLAGKLQGGDYDGDMFWLCWESSLVDPFKNAPAPVQSPEPMDYGIQTEKRTLEDVMDPNNIDTVNGFLKEAFGFRSHPSLLGWATTVLEQQAYRENQVFSDVLDRLCDIHDLLVDSQKQGFIFTQAAFDKYFNRTLRLGRPRQPPYKLAMNDCLKARNSIELEKVRSKSYQHSPDRILDFLYFDVVRAHNIETMKRVKQILSKPKEPDTSLLYPHQNLFRQKSQVIHEELRTLKGNLQRVFRNCNIGFHRESTADQKTALVEKCYQEYLAIQPVQIDHAEIKPWVTSYLRHGSALWDGIKASALYALYPRPEKAEFVFKMAGNELARLKAQNVHGTRFVVPQIYNQLKPRRIKAPVESNEIGESEDEFEDAVEHITG